MNYGELVEAVYKETRYDEYGWKDLTKEKVEKVISKAIEVSMNELRQGREVSIRDFGKLFVKRVRPRKVNGTIGTGNIVIEGHKAVRFKAFDKLKKTVW